MILPQKIQNCPKIMDYRLILKYDTKGNPIYATSLSRSGTFFAYSNEK